MHRDKSDYGIMVKLTEEELQILSKYLGEKIREFNTSEQLENETAILNRIKKTMDIELERLRDTRLDFVEYTDERDEVLQGILGLKPIKEREW